MKPIRNDTNNFDLKKRKQMNEVDEKMARFNSFLKEAGVTHYLEIQSGDPRDVILQVAERKKVSYIVMGSRGLSGIKSLLMGSNSSYIVEQSKVPVMIVK